MKLRGIILALTCILFGLYQTIAQSLLVSNYETIESKKLTNRLITDIVRDHHGFLWIGAEDGLNRYDGKRFDQFKHTYRGNRKISGIRVEKIIHRSDEKLVIKYLYNRNSLEIFDPVTWESERIYFDDLLKEIGEIVDIYQNQDDLDVIVLISKPGLASIYQLTNDNLLESKAELKMDRAKAISIQKTLQSDWLIFDNGQIIEVGKDGKLRRKLTAPPLDHFDMSREKFVNFIHEVNGGDCVFSFEAIPGLFMLRQGVDTLSDLHDFVPEEYYSHVWKDEKGNRLLYAGSSFRPEQKLFFWNDEIQELQNVSSWLSNQNQVTAIYGQNFTEGFAIGYTNGFDIIHVISDQFQRLLTREVRPDGWGTSIRGIWQDPYENTYVAREINHWFKISKAGNIDTIELFEKNDVLDYKFKCSKNLVSAGSYIIGSAHLPNNTFTILLYDPASNTIEQIPIKHHVQHIEIIEDIAWIVCGEDKQEAALYQLDLNTKELEQFVNEAGENPFQTDILFSLEEVRDGVFWIGSRIGIYEIDLQSKTVSHFNYKSDYPLDFIDTWIFDIKRHSSGKIYIGYRSAGFEIIDLEKGSKKQFTVNDGLANDDIASFIEDTTGIMWIGTYNGLSKFDPESEDFINFYQNDGLPHNEFNRYSAHIGDKEIWMGTINGVTTFNPYTLRSIAHKPHILLSELRYFNKKGEEENFLGHYEEPVELIIPAGNSSIELSFNLDNFLTTRENTFSYRLGNKENENWISLGTENMLSLNYLRAGSYPLEIKGEDKYGNPSTNQIILNLHVRQYLYESAWLYAFVALCLIGLTFLFFRARFIQKIRLYRVRQDISRDLHDEVGSLLTGLAMKTDLLSMRVAPNLKGETKKLGLMGREAVRLMRDIVWSIDSSKNTVGDLIDRVKEFASEVFPEKGIEYEVGMHNCQPTMRLKSDIRKNVYLIIRESINNILKHSNATYVIIQLKKEEGSCQVLVSDNGSNSETNHNPSGLGLKNMKERAQHIGGHLKLHRENGYEVLLSFQQ